MKETNSLASDDRLLELTNAHCDQRLTPAEAQELRSMLLASEQCLDLFLAYMELHGELLHKIGRHDIPSLPLDIAAAATGTPTHVLESLRNEATSRQGNVERSESRWRRTWLIATAALVLICLGLAVWFTLDQTLLAPGHRSVATVGNSFHVHWKAGANELSNGDMITGGTIEIERGLLEMETSSGVLLIVEGPTRLAISEQGEWRLDSGRVYVDLNRASSFSIYTPHGRVCDLGTRFGLDVTKSRLVVQVDEGEVSVEQETGAGGFTVGALETFQFVTGSSPQSLPFAAERFTSQLPIANDSTQDMSTIGRNGRLNSTTTPSITVPRVAWPIVIDGDLTQWESNDKLIRSADPPYANTYSATVWLGYDENALYLAAKISDPNGMRSQIDPHVTPRLASSGGCVQLRLGSNRSPPTEPIQLTMWHFAETETACLLVQNATTLEPIVVNPAGFEGMFRRIRSPDSSHTMEYRIPWNLLERTIEAPTDGSTLKAQLTITFADESGRHEIGRIEEILAPEDNSTGKPRPQAWGEARFGGRW